MYVGTHVGERGAGLWGEESLGVQDCCGIVKVAFRFCVGFVHGAAVAEKRACVVEGPAQRTVDGARREAPRPASAASAVQEKDPSAALAEVTQGEPLVAQAQALAEADVRGAGPWGSDGRSGRGGGLDVGSLVLGGLLLGGLTGGHHDYGGWGGSDLDFDLFD